MDKVYAVFVGEQYDSEQLVSLHAGFDSAMKAAYAVMYEAAKEDGIVFAAGPDGKSWRAKSGHYVAVESRPLVG